MMKENSEFFCPNYLGVFFFTVMSSGIEQALVVQRQASAIQRINHYLLGKSNQNLLSYPMDIDLSNR